MAPRAKLTAVRVLDDEGSGSFEDVARGIRYAADRGADAINLSLGALPAVQRLVITGLLTDVADAIAYANRKGAVVVAAAGNEAAALLRYARAPGLPSGAPESSTPRRLPRP